MPNHEPQPTVLVVGANGTTAGMVVAELRRRGINIRGMTRSEHGRAAAQRNGAHEVVIGDLTDQDSLRRAVDGVDGVFLLTPAMADQEAEMGVAMVDAAIELCAPGEVSVEDLASIMAEVGQRPVEAGRFTPSENVPESLRLMFRHYDSHGFRGGNSLVMTAALGRRPTTIRDYIGQLATSTA